MRDKAVTENLLLFFYVLGQVALATSRGIQPDRECWWCGDKWHEHGGMDVPCFGVG